MGEPDRMKEADLALTNGVLSGVAGLFTVAVAWAFSVISTLGGESLQVVHLPVPLLAVAGIIVGVLCWGSFRALLRLRGGSDRGWFYGVVLAADLVWLLLAEAALIGWGGRV
jgi:hypothetical protein